MPPVPHIFACFTSFPSLSASVFVVHDARFDPVDSREFTSAEPPIDKGDSIERRLEGIVCRAANVPS